MKFSLIHPSRNRVARAEDAVREWTSRFSGVHECEHIMSVDADDPQMDGYAALAARHGLRLVVGHNRTMVEAVNRGAEHATGDLLIVVSDDFGCPAAWDVALAAVADGALDRAVLVDDGLGARIMTLPIIGRAFYARQGYVYHPAYISMFADDDLTAVARRDGLLVDATHLVFPHRHFSAALSASDDTYARQNSGRAWWHGWRTFEKRKGGEFGRRPARWPLRFRIDAYYWMRVIGSRLRRRWLRRLPRALGGWETRMRSALLRLIGQLTSNRFHG